MKEADKTAGALEAGKAGKSKEAAGSGRPLQHSRAHETLRPPDLCRKREAEVVIMWSVTMCRSEKFQYDFDTSVRKYQIQTCGGFACWNLITESSPQCR